jgi:hypothetical protein
MTKVEGVDAGVSDEEETAEDMERPVRPLKIRVKAIGPSKAVFEWLHGYQKRGDFLAVEHFKAIRESPHEDILSIDAEVSGLRIAGAATPKGSNP